MNSMMLNTPDLTYLADQQTALAGLHFYSLQDEYSGGVTGTGSLNAKLSLELCSDHYVFDDTATFSVTVDGASLFDKSGEAHEGSWQLGYDLAGQVIFMESTRGQPYSMRLTTEGNQIFLDGQLVAAAQSERCP